ncbi:MAG: DUF692 domain-containing protein [Pseudomonadota bacterium]
MNGTTAPDFLVQSFPVQGAGLGLRRSFLAELDSVPAATLPDFFEIAPENWIGLGGRYARDLRALTERHCFVTHGLSLSIGGPAPLDIAFLQRLRKFLDSHQIATYSEHLSYTGDAGHLYDLLPIPMTEAAADYVAARVRQVQDILGRRIALENVSTYAAPGSEMSELDFVCQVLEKADCDLLLDVNNIFVNSINHGFNADSYLRSLPAQRIRYAHIAGHFVEAEDLRIDTHGDDVCADVWAFLRTAYEHFGTFPTLLERDFNIPALPELLAEMSIIRQHQQAHRDAA